MNKRFCLLASLLVLAFVLAFSHRIAPIARAGPARIVIEGIVVDGSYKGIPGVTVTLWRDGGGPTMTEPTGRDGGYRFELDPGGTIDVSYAHSALGSALVNQLSGFQSHRIGPVIFTDTTKIGLIRAHSELQSIEHLAVLALTDSGNTPSSVSDLLRGQPIVERVKSLGELEPASPRSALVLRARSSLTLSILNSYRQGSITPEPARALPAASGITKAIAHMLPTVGSDVRGTVTFTQEGREVHVRAEISGLTPGEHGFHIHEYGVWSADGFAAGAHFNPTRAPHAGIQTERRHVGDLGNITANANGIATVDIEDTLITLHGADSILGRAVVVHEKADDLKSQPAGNAGGRLAVGVIGIANP
jgi:superoxide dismutase, Cu-Zn family